MIVKQYIKDFENTALYHWTEYEVKKMKNLAGKNPQDTAKLKALCNICKAVTVHFSFW